MITEKTILEVFDPQHLNAFASCWLDSKIAYDDSHDDVEQLELGKLHRALEVNRKTLGRARRSPILSASFVPAKVKGLDFLRYDGADADLAILFKKLRKNRAGRLESNNIMTEQQIGRRAGQLLFNNKRLIPIVCGYTVCNGIGSLATFDAVYIGYESLDGFEWAYPIWTLSKGFVAPHPEEQQPLFPQAIVRIRRMDTVAMQDISDKAGIDVQREREQRQRRAKESGDGHATGRGA